MRVSLSKINNFLLALIILVNAYVIAGPFIPNLLWHWQAHTGRRQQLEVKVRRQTTGSQPNSIIIPSMLLDQPIFEGSIANQYKVLNQGIWRWPRGSTPDKGGNTVLIGHRFTYTNPRGVFYFLNRVKIGDSIGVVWNNHTYSYRVASVSEVPSNDTAIENQTTQPELTLFTCTPLWFPKDRLVVVARPEFAP